MEKTITGKFIDSMWDFSQKSTDKKIVDEVKYCLTDYLACTMLGAKLLEKESLALYEAYGANNGLSSVIGTDKKASAPIAALINGFNSHYIELDDGQRYAMLHLGGTIFSAMLAVSQDRDLNVKQFIKGVIVGYEATIRLASAIQPGHKLKGFHGTGSCGTIGAAIGIAAALDYPKDKWNIVVSAAATDASSLLELQEDGSDIKPYNIARASTCAINAAYLGATGLMGPRDSLGGKRGFFAVATDKVNEEYLLNGFGERYGIETIYRKPYAACRHCHAAIEAALNIKSQCQLDINKINRIEVDTYSLAVKGHEHRSIDGASSAKMSMPYSVASALVFGKVSYLEYSDECLKDSLVNKLMQMTYVVEDEDLSKLVPAKRAARVKIFCGDNVFENQVDFPLGEPENPITYAGLKEKFCSLMTAAGKNEDFSNQMLYCIENIENEFSTMITMI